MQMRKLRPRPATEPRVTQLICVQASFPTAVLGLLVLVCPACMLTANNFPVRWWRKASMECSCLGMYLVEERENVRVCTHTYAAGLCIYAAVFENVDHHSF